MKLTSFPLDAIAASYEAAAKADQMVANAKRQRTEALQAIKVNQGCFSLRYVQKGEADVLRFTYDPEHDVKGNNRTQEPATVDIRVDSLTQFAQFLTMAEAKLVGSVSKSDARVADAKAEVRELERQLSTIAEGGLTVSPEAAEQARAALVSINDALPIVRRAFGSDEA